jgi:hypothetical protein
LEGINSKDFKEPLPSEVQLQTIYKEMGDYITLTDYYKEPWKDNLQPRYQCWIRGYLNILKKEGLVESVRRGYWRYIFE